MCRTDGKFTDGPSGRAQNHQRPTGAGHNGDTRADGQLVPGFTLADATELFGDELDRTYTWKSGTDVSALAGKPVQLRFVMKDADLYSFRFAE